jgi:glutamine amidotransferase
MQRVVLVDLGMGNLRSVERALSQAAQDRGVECEVVRSGRADDVARADKVVVPGQGAFRDCAAALAGELGGALRDKIASGAPFFGICLGLQALFVESEEAPGEKGLGIFAGEVKRLELGTGTNAVKIPHMGWNRLEIARRCAGPLEVYDDDPPYVYFVHSYHAVPADASLVVAWASHGPNRITAAIQRDNVTATQFHPEKSQAAGLRLLGKFLSG